MLNVIAFRKNAAGSPGPGQRRPPVDVEVDIDELAGHVAGLQSKARGEIGNAILMLDLAAQHAREIAVRISDPSVKRAFDEHIAIIERLIELAREMAFKL
jgi:hypothetical protein